MIAVLDQQSKHIPNRELQMFSTLGNFFRYSEHKLGLSFPKAYMHMFKTGDCCSTTQHPRTPPWAGVHFHPWHSSG